MKKIKQVAIDMKKRMKKLTIKDVIQILIIKKRRFMKC
jgi:hypothetical protein